MCADLAARLDMGQPQVFKAEVVDGYKGTGNLTADSSSETNSNSPWLVFTVKSTRPRSDAVRAVFLKLGELPSNEPAKSAPAARRKLDSRQTDDPCHLSALKVESDKCVSMHTMAVPFAEVEKCGNFKVNNGTLMPGNSSEDVS